MRLRDTFLQFLKVLEAQHSTHRCLAYVGARNKRFYSNVLPLVRLLVGSTLGGHRPNKLRPFFRFVYARSKFTAKNEQCQEAMTQKKQFKCVGKWFSVFHYLTLTFSLCLVRMSSTCSADAFVFTRPKLYCVFSPCWRRKFPGWNKSLMIKRVFSLPLD